MSALFLGLVAALAWGVHDICVRRVSQRTSVLAALLTVLVAGSAFQMIWMGLQGAFAPVPLKALVLSCLSGLCFTIASIGLYRAFAVGPVRLVSPIIAAYPILSVGWAAISGSPVTPLQWLAVIAVITGISVATGQSGLSEDTEQANKRTATILWAILAGIGFAGTFAIGQAATEIAPDLPVILVTRLTAIAVLVAVMRALRAPFLPGRGQLLILGTMGMLDAVALVCVLSAGGLPHAEYAAVAASVFGMVTILLAWVFLKERLSPTQCSGVLITFSGIGYLAL